MAALPPWLPLSSPGLYGSQEPHLFQATTSAQLSSSTVVVLHLTRVEANIDLKDKGKGVLEGHLQEQGMLGASAATPSNNRLLREFKDEGLQASAHSRVVRRLREIQGQGRIK